MFITFNFIIIKNIPAPNCWNKNEAYFQVRNTRNLHIFVYKHTQQSCGGSWCIFLGPWIIELSRRYIVVQHGESWVIIWPCRSSEGGNPRDAMSLCCADTNLPDLLGRLSLRYADQAFAMQTMPPLCSKQASTIRHSFFKSWFLWVMKMLTTLLT